ncbi:inner membrane transport protein yieO [Schizosaccharomyces octosporus yFS286]|uniref:Inner membrane transport protein yieO n=1 Tax=Schizosaccharomyces octosporus (strain yFS286) TaxID=483514 RepID=S9RFD8_SCHOY|nr:inner membrane transport protein yieO [Schizosaccharomyces octosporus yFS286]EPX72799.1 inner membrane transport protein yieO [Schizosaccharomyces octosporus yFS286]
MHNSIPSTNTWDHYEEDASASNEKPLTSAVSTDSNTTDYIPRNHFPSIDKTSSAVLSPNTSDMSDYSKEIDEKGGPNVQVRDDTNNTIVTVALPTISEHFHDASRSFWIGTSYSLATNAILPAVGVLSNIIGRKPMLYASVFFFMLGSALSGASQNMIMLIVCRAIQGLGGGGITSLVNIIISDITPLKTRPIYTGLVASAWGMALVLGPILGGVICQRTTWRWIFFINLPVGGIAISSLILFLRVLPVQGQTFRKFSKTFDFFGLITIITGVVLFLLGISLGASSGRWSRPGVLPYIVIGAVLVATAFIYDFNTKRNAVLPSTFFLNINSLSLLVCSFVHFLNYYLFSYYIPQYFQRIRGDDPIMAGVHFLPGGCVLCCLTISVGIVLKKLGRYKPLLYIGAIACTAGMGSLISLGAYTSFSKSMGLTTIYMFGSGFLFLPPMIAMQAAFPPSLMSMATATLMFIRNMGGAIGITIGEVIFSQRVTGVFHDSSIATLSYQQIQQRPADEQGHIEETFASAFRTIWIFATIAMAIGTLAVFFVKSNSIDQKTEKVPAKEHKDEQV